MQFLRSLVELKKAKSLARIDFDDGGSEVGFVVYADEETFDMYILDNVFNEKILNEEPDGEIMLDSEEDVKGIDFIFTKASYSTSQICSVVHDISHKFPIEKTYFFGTSSDAIYKNEEKVQAFLEGKKTRKTVFTNFPSSIKTDTFTIKGNN